MNRSILIVICDFLVLSAMSLSMGLAKPSPAGSGVTESVRPVTHTYLLEQLEKAVRTQEAASDENERLSREAEEKAQTLQQMKDQIAAREKELLQLENQLSAAEDDSARRDAELHAQREHSKSLSEQLARKEQQLALLQKDLAIQAKKMDAKETLIRSQAESIRTRETEIRAKEETIREKGQELEGARLTIAEQNAALKYSKMALEEKSKELKNVEKDLKGTSEELVKTIQSLRNQEDAIAAAKKRLAERDADLFQLQMRLAEQKTEHEKTVENLQSVSGQLKQMEDENRKAREETKKAQEEKAFREGELRRAEEQIEALNKKVGSAEVLLKEKETEIQNNRHFIADLKGQVAKEIQRRARLQHDLVKTTQELRTQTDLSLKRERDLIVSRQETKDVSTRLAAKDEILRQTRTELDRKNAQLTDRTISAYSGAVRKLSLSLKNDRFFTDFNYKNSFYLPQVSLNGKVFLVGAVESVTGLLDQKGGYTQLAELNYTLDSPAGSAKPGAVRLEAPFYAPGGDPRICLIEIPGTAAGGKPLEPLSPAEIKVISGGTGKNLTLFKATRYGEEYTSLDSRCSLRPDREDYMMIRNSLRNSSEIAAQVGDFVIAKDGRLAGVVVRVVDYPAEGRSDAWCRLFPKQVDFSHAVRIPIVKAPGEETYLSFVKTLNALHKTIQDWNRTQVK